MSNYKSILRQNRIRIGDILDVCSDCTKPPQFRLSGSWTHDITYCQTNCTLYTEMQKCVQTVERIQAETRKEVSKTEEYIPVKRDENQKPKRQTKPCTIPLTVPEYVDLKYRKGKKRKEIAQLKGLTGKQVTRWEQRRKEEINNELKSISK